MTITMEGALSKWTNVMKGWQYRWFVLDDSAGIFSYYTSKDKMTRGVRRGCVRLRGALIGIDDEDDATFTITVDGKTFHFQAQDSEERERWIRALEETVLRHNSTRRTTSSLRKSTLLIQGDSPPTIEDFDKKLSETDCYLQILLNQVAALKFKIDDPETSSEAKTKYEEIAEKAIGMTESIKHGIVLLQIAKNATLPEVQFKAKQQSDREQSVSPKQSPVSRPGAKHKHAPKVISAIENTFTIDSNIETGIVIGTECQELQQKSSKSPGSSAGSPNLKPLKTTAIPEISYSSSEDEDFFDAEEDDSDDDVDETSDMTDMRTPPQPPTTLDLSAIALETSINDINSPITPIEGQEIDWDALYGPDEEEETEVDMKSQGSVITHLLSQVRIGMDLTKIVLPTFILERRSLLEMYSDFFAHPDLFVSIADGQTPEDRMVTVLKWYLSSFHAGRRSSIAKKPYNPILGETFRCHWKLDDDDKKEEAPEKESEKASEVDSDRKLTDEGPLPWCKSDDLVFVAEQVSHHPPITAFYCEHVKKRIAVNAHIYTKSSFLGMSVAVHNIGQGKLTLLDHNEEYVVSFPSGFARSILTVPWVELGGKISINCPQTNYTAQIEFKCKQFFSSDVNKVTAEVCGPGQKKPFLKVDGEWNGKMMAKWTNSGRTEVFVDVNQMTISDKLCKKVNEQLRYESRRLWRDVTYGLKSNDIEAATAGKFALEQRQREEAAQRKEAGVKWDTKLFHQVGENWFFNEPLPKRIRDHKLAA